MAPHRNAPCPCGSGKKFKHCCGGVQRQPPTDAQPALDHAIRLYEAGRFHEALPLCQALLRQPALQPQIFHLAGMVHYRLGDLAQAWALLKQAAPRMRHDAAFIEHYALVAHAVGDLDAAAKAYRDAIKASAMQDASLHFNLGVVLQQSGQYREALPVYAQALKQEPAAFDVHVNMGRSFFELGDYTLARAHYETALGLVPDDATLLGNLAELSEKEFDCETAAQLYRASLAQAERPAVWMALLRLLMRRGEVVLAGEELLRLVARFPDEPAFSHLLAELYFEQSDYGAADSVFRCLLERQPAAATQTLLRWAQQYERRNRLDDALQLLEKIPADATEQKAALLLRAKVLRRQGRLDDARLLLEQIVPPEGRIDAFAVEYYFELGTLQDREQDYRQAFESMVRANRINRVWRHERFDQVHQRRAYRHARQTLNAQLLAGLPRCDSRDSGCKPLFIIGFPRSGTTLLEQMLGAHAQVRAGGELPFMVSLEGSGCQQALQSRRPYPDCLADAHATLDCAAVARMRAVYHRGAAGYGLTAAGVRYFTDKMPLNLLYLPLLRLVFPDSPVVHIIRHPLDVCLSVFFTNFSQGNRFAMKLEDTAFAYAEVMSLAEHFKQHLNMRYLEIRYEDLVADAQHVLTQVLQFAGLDWDPACLAFAAASRVAKTASYEQVSQHLYNSSVGRWRHYTRELAGIAEYLAPTIAALGYHTR